MRRVSTVFLILVVVLMMNRACAADQSDLSTKESQHPARLTLPKFAARSHADRPQLPRTWRCVALLAPFKIDNSQLVVGEFIFDGSIPAFRATLYGAEEGAVDLLITDRGTFRLESKDRKVKRGIPIVANWHVPSADWLGPEAKCLGEANLLEEKVEWWKRPVKIQAATPSVNPEIVSTTWFWYSVARPRFPWRTMFAEPAAEPAVVGSFALTYFAEFTKDPNIDLEPVARLCATTKPASSEEHGLADVMQLIGDDKTSGIDRVARVAEIKRLIPGIEVDGAGFPKELPRWQRRFGMTTFMTPVNFAFNPFPTEVYYTYEAPSSPGERKQRTRMLQPAGDPYEYIDALLLDGVGYDVRRSRTSCNDSCDPRLPGIPRLDWMERDGGACKATINNHPRLSPGRKTMVIMCPLVDDRMFWTWYTIEGKPLVFMETAAPASEGTGLALADYNDWTDDPQLEFPVDVFSKPGRCNDSTSSPDAVVFFHHGTHGNAQSFASSEACFKCHVKTGGCKSVLVFLHWTGMNPTP